MGETLNQKNWKNQLPFWGILALLLIWPLLFVNRGVDLLDTAFYLGGYKWGLRDPAYLSYDMPLSDLTGGLLYSLMPGHQLLLFRILDILANWAICLCIYQMVGKKQNTLLLLGMLAGSLFLKRLTMTLSYNTFSTLFCALAMLGTVKGLEKQKGWIIALAGAAAGFNVLYRPPNLLQSTIILAIPLYGWLSGWKWKQIFTYCLLFVAAYFAALAAAFGIVVMAKGLEETMAGYLALARLGTTDTGDNPHSIKNMLLTTARGLIMGTRITLESALAALLVALGLAAAIHFLKRKNREKQWSRILGISGILTGAVLAVAAREQYWEDYSLYFFLDFYSRAMALACIVGGLCLIFCRKLEPRQAVLGLLLGGSVFYMALGTSNGLFQFIIFGAPIVGLTVYLLGVWQRFAGKEREGRAGRVLPYVRFLSLAVMTSLLLECFLVGGHLLKTYTYWDDAPDQLTAEVRVPELAGMKTSPEKAAMLEQFRADMADPAMEGYSLAVSDSFCAAYVITDNPPFFPLMWPSLDSYPMEDFRAALQAGEDRGDLPIIVISHIPYVSSTSQEKTELLKSFAEKHGYQAVCWREDYRILVPPLCWEAMESRS